MQDYKKEIIKLVKRVNDAEMLDLIYQLLKKHLSRS